MNILISGGSGFLGSAFSETLITSAQSRQQPLQITWLTRDASQAHPDAVKMMTYEALAKTDNHYDVIINLAGAGIADARWSESRKAQLLASRTKPTEALLAFIERTAVAPKLLISGSAIGWYGTQGDKPLTEDSGFEDDFAHRLCQEWEMLAAKAATYGVPVAIVRTGVVIHPDGGMLGKLLTPFKLGVGGQLGDGSQIMSWISREDWVSAICFIMSQHVSETDVEPDKNDEATVTVYNLTAPNPVSNHTFTKAVGSWLHRPTVFTLPRSLLTLLFGEMSTLLVDGQKVLPEALLTQGYEFEHQTIQQALRAPRG